MEFPKLSTEEHQDEPVQLHAEDVDIPAGIPSITVLTNWLNQMATHEKAPLLEVNYIFCSDDFLLEMNKEYLQHDYYTDVITFQMEEKAISGDIFISIDRVADNAAQLGVDMQAELLRVMAHGALHLAGFGDKSPEEEATMRKKENEYLAMLF